MTSAEITAAISTIVGAALGAFMGFVYKTKSEIHKEKKNILGVLMAYRGKYKDNEDFQHALNMIDLYFYKNKKIRAKRIEYLRSLQAPYYDTGEHAQNLIDLILLISADIGYKGLSQSDVLWYYNPLKDSTSPES